VRGEIAAAEAALADLVAGIEAAGFRWEPAGGRDAEAGPG